MGKRKWGFVLAAAVVVAVASKKEWRERVCVEAQLARKQAEDAYIFLRDNREEMVTQAKETIEGVNLLWKDVSNDVRAITEKAAHIRNTSEEAIHAAKEAADEIKALKKQRELE
ncbi:hypothetical protein ACE1TH_18225 [Shouchella sp. JSM 1781072]|uniref:hypothetical protein n=1 Tax=Bacillaceae TaxID=186817 RepID=UPI000C06EE37|nr:MULTISPECIES: hypothetical protein [Bacillaceae]UTR07670.1 hypothetical protein MM326_06465 [Alkalihalobacillus sp. LMS6]